jgi:hypothetical protein
MYRQQAKCSGGQQEDAGENDDVLDVVWSSLDRLCYACKYGLFDNLQIEVSSQGIATWRVASDQIADWSINLDILCRAELALPEGYLLPIGKQHDDEKAYFQALRSLVDAEAACSTVESNPTSIRYSNVTIFPGSKHAFTLTIPLALCYLEQHDWLHVRLFDKPSDQFPSRQGLVRVREAERCSADKRSLIAKLDWLETPELQQEASFARITLRVHQLTQTARHWYKAVGLVDKHPKQFLVAKGVIYGGASMNLPGAGESSADMDFVDQVFETLGHVEDEATPQSKAQRETRAPHATTGAFAALAVDTDDEVSDGEAESPAVGVASRISPNEEQAQAIHRMLLQPLTLVHGPAGTGKTFTAVTMALVSS